jgi:hypothetical protein
MQINQACCPTIKHATHNSTKILRKRLKFSEAVAIFNCQRQGSSLHILFYFISRLEDEILQTKLPSVMKLHSIYREMLIDTT